MMGKTRIRSEEKCKHYSGNSMSRKTTWLRFDCSVLVGKPVELCGNIGDHS